MTVNLLLLALLLSCAALVLALILSRRYRRQYRRTLDNLPVGLLTVDGNGTIVLWNREMATLSDIGREQASGRSIDELPAPWPEALREALDQGSSDVIKRPLAEQEGAEVRWVILHSGAVSSGEHTVLVEDISDYQRLQDDVLHRERLASIGRLAAGVAHEIGNPVTGIACLAQNLKDGAEPEETAQSAEEILKQTNRISRIVDSLVQFSHSGGNAQTVECGPCNLADCVDEAIHLLSLDREASEGHFLNHCDRELLVTGDNQLLLQVFVNLLDNARSASPSTESIVVDAVEGDEGVTVSVDNGGDPIAPQVLEQMFEPFFTTKDVGDGTGLGLPLVRGMLKDMGGEIAIHSPRPAPEGDGARAVITLASAEYDHALIG